MSEDERIARQFHATYERLSAEYGYNTRLDTREFDPESPNGRLMIATVREIMLGLRLTRKERKAIEFAAKHFGAFKSQAATLLGILDRLR